MTLGPLAELVERGDPDRFLAAMAARLHNDRDAEIAQALREIDRIAARDCARIERQ